VAAQDGQIIVVSSDKMWPTRGENGKPLQYSFCENPKDSMKRQKEMTPEDNPPRSKGIQHTTEEEQRTIIKSSRKNEVAGTTWKWSSVLNVLLEDSVCFYQYVLLAKLCYPLPCFILYFKAKFAC